jgi:hypothetical protein
MLSTAQLASMQVTIAGSLPDLCTIEHVSKVADGAGGVTGPVEKSVAVPVRYAEVTDRRSGPVTTDVLFGNPAWMFTFTAGTDIGIVDRIHVDNRTWEVKAVFNRTWEVSLRVFATELARGLALL